MSQDEDAQALRDKLVAEASRHGYDAHEARRRARYFRNPGDGESNGRARIALTPRNRQVIALHLNGMRHAEIGQLVGLTPNRVTQILNSRAVKELLTDVYQIHDAELTALMGRSIDAVRGALDSRDHKHTLRAAEMVFKTQGKFKEGEHAAETAEDVITRALHAIKRVDSDGASTTEVKLVEQRAGSALTKVEEFE